ncbi:MAG: PfkB family carbohydrate kinase [archaeon]|nr:PfkB family carbohydrate kinase [archaeon]
MIISFSTATFDNINGKEYLGGPANYGGAIIDFFGEILNLDTINFVNVGKKDLHKIITLNHRNLIPNYIDSSVKFKLSYHNQKRICQILSKSFSVSKYDITNYGLEEFIKNSTIIVSPVINEFPWSFFNKLVNSKPKAIFLDLFNNDDGNFSKSELALLNNILSIKGNKLFIKLSENEIRGLIKAGIDLSNTSLLITRGKTGAELIHNKFKAPIISHGIKVKTINSTGAGDVFLYVFATMYEYGLPLKKCLRIANKIAAISTSYDTIEEFCKAIRKNKKIIQSIAKK